MCIIWKPRTRATRLHGQGLYIISPTTVTVIVLSMRPWGESIDRVLRRAIVYYYYSVIDPTESDGAWVHEVLGWPTVPKHDVDVSWRDHSFRFPCEYDTIYVGSYSKRHVNTHMVPWANPSPPPNGISIGSAVFARLAIVTDRPTDRQTEHDTPSVKPWFRVKIKH